MNLPPLAGIQIGDVMQKDSGKSVFFIDDDPGMLDYLQSLFTAFFPDFRIAGSCSSLPEAVLLLKNLEPVCIITDVNLPVFRGTDLPGLFQENSIRLPELLIFISADEKNSRNIPDAPGFFFLTKPLMIPELSRILNRQTPGS